MLLPESHQLFVCPSACGRHAAIGAMQHGLKDRLSFLYVDQSDIIEGYDALIEKAAGDLLEALYPKTPRVLLIFTSCLDDLIGTDHKALNTRLSKAHPGVLFRDCHMNPISLDSDLPPGVSLQEQIYSLLETAPAPLKRDGAVNSVGNLEPMDKSGELYDFLRHYGRPEFRHISEYDRFDDFLSMAASSLNLVTGPGGMRAAGRMQTALGIPYIFLPVSYRLEKIASNYGLLRDKLGGENIPPFDLDSAETEARSKIRTALEALGDLPIIVDDSSVTKPFELARALLEYGFRVSAVVTGECSPIDRENLDWLLERAPGVDIVQPEHHNAVRFERRIEESLAIGLSGAYLTGSAYLLDMIDDGGLYGYHGVKTLAERMTAAVERKADLRAVIESYGLVV
jgi:nitrogenase molybdenum-iron protein alpha/beta subunit